jgi:hypothetical protein
VEEKNGSLQGYSTNLKFSGREKRISAGLLNKFITSWTRKTNHCRDTQQIYISAVPSKPARLMVIYIVDIYHMSY